MAVDYLGGFYALGMQVNMSDPVGWGPNKRFTPEHARRWTFGGSCRLRPGHSIKLHYVGDTLVRVESVHAWGFALIEAVQIATLWEWPSILVRDCSPSLFVEVRRLLEPHCVMYVTLQMADLQAETLPRISDDERPPLELEGHFELADESDTDGQ